MLEWKVIIYKLKSYFKMQNVAIFQNEYCSIKYL